MILFGNQQNRATYNPVTVTIGTQVWALANFSESTLINGTVIPEVTDPTAWAALTTAAWCNYENNTSYGTEYGKLYNFYANALIDAAYTPYGWRIPTIAEWTTLVNYLGGASVAGGKIKEIGTAHWNGNTGTTNSSGLTILGAGMRLETGVFNYLKTYSANWASDLSTFRLECLYNSNSITLESRSAKRGFSIRLIKI